MEHVTSEELDAGLTHIEGAPRDEGSVVMVVRRPAEDEREVLETARLDPAVGLVGDSWADRRGDRPPETQLTIMSARSIALIAGPEERWPPAGDQVYVDFDLSETNIPPGTRLNLGSAVVEVSDIPHTGCKKFSARYGLDAWRWVNSPVGRSLNLRGINVRVVEPGEVAPGDVVKKA
jgi:MOSC domain-containing protein YiiM